MKVKIKSKRVETEEVNEQELDEAWYDAVKAGAQALNPLKGVTQKVGKFVQDARGASLEADAKRQITELVKLMDSVAPKFQQLADRAAKLYGGDMKHPMVGAILGIKRNITTHRNALQSLTTKPLLQGGQGGQQNQPAAASKPATANPATAGTGTANPATAGAASTTQTNQSTSSSSANPASAGTSAAGTTASPSQTQQNKTVVDRSTQATPSNLGTNRPSVKNMPPLKNPKDEEAYKRLIAMRDSGKKLDANQQKRLQQLMQMKLQQEPAQSAKPKPKIQTPDFTTNDKTRKSTGV